VWAVISITGNLPVAGSYDTPMNFLTPQDAGIFLTNRETIRYLPTGTTEKTSLKPSAGSAHTHTRQMYFHFCLRLFNITSTAC